MSGSMAFSTIDSEPGRFSSLRGLPSLRRTAARLLRGSGHVGVVRPQRFLADGERSPVETLGIGNFPDQARAMQAASGSRPAGDDGPPSSFWSNQGARLACWRSRLSYPENAGRLRQPEKCSGEPLVADTSRTSASEMASRKRPSACLLWPCLSAEFAELRSCFNLSADAVRLFSAVAFGSEDRTAAGSWFFAAAEVSTNTTGQASQTATPKVVLKADIQIPRPVWIKTHPDAINSQSVQAHDRVPRETDGLLMAIGATQLSRKSFQSRGQGEAVRRHRRPSNQGF